MQFVMDWLNDRLRKTSGGRSPNKLFMGQRADKTVNPYTPAGFTMGRFTRHVMTRIT